MRLSTNGHSGTLFADTATLKTVLSAYGPYAIE
jgi:hypothetical protein